MNREQHQDFIETTVVGYDKFMELYEASPVDSPVGSRFFLKAYALKEAGEAAVRAYAALPSGVDDTTAWKACQEAIKQLVKTAEHSMHAAAYAAGNPKVFPPSLEAYVDETNNTILGYELALVCINNYK